VKGLRPLTALALVGSGLAAALLLAEGMVRLAARWSPSVGDLADARPAAPSRPFDSLAAFLATRPTQVIPHRSWLNYWNNALGLNDEEFVVPKPPGRVRVMALGDSFTYGVVPYPDAAMTRLEASLRAACPGLDLDVLNFGIGGAGVEDYRTLATLALPTYSPDLVVVHFYAGNDGPDLYRLVHERSRWRAWLGASRLWTFATNLLRLRRDVHEGVRAAGDRPDPPPPGAPAPRGGGVVDPRRPVPADHPAVAGPTYTPKAFDTILAGELRRLYAPPDPAVAEGAWQPVLDALDAIRARVEQGGGRLAVVVYPSVLQVDPALREALVPRLRQRRRYTPLDPAAVDPALPQARLAAYCARAGLACFDLTPALAAAHRAAPDPPLYKLRDPHWTVRGNRVAAEAEAGHLAGLVCPGRPG
jgi:lysophospholipase L1-like esterase